MRHAWLCCVVFAAPLAAASVAPASPPASARIRVVAQGDYPPYLFRNADGHVSGYVADRWRLFEKHTGIRVELDPIDWDAAKQDVQNGSADAIDLIYRSDAREPLFDFTPPYLTVPLDIYVDSRDRDVHDLASLHGLTVNVGRGNACASTLTRLGITDLRQFDEFKPVVTAAIRTKPHIFCMDENRAYHYLEEIGAQENFSRAFVLDTGHFHIAVRKGNTAMLQLIERGMASITPAENRALEERWLQQWPQPSSHGRIAAIALAVALALIVLMLAWIWTLRRSVAIRTSELQAKEAKIRTLFNINPDAVWMKDLQGVYHVCNKRVLESLHLDMEPRDLLGHTDAKLFPPDKVALVRAMDARAIRRGAQDAYERHEKSAVGMRSNTRNGATKKRLKGTFGEIEVTTQRDRSGTFEPVLVKKRQTRLGDFEDKILALYARGMSTRDIESAVVDLYGVRSAMT